MRRILVSPRFYLDLARSLVRLVRIVVCGRHHRVVFYASQHFNRGAGATNLFFAPLLAACDSHRIDYLLMEEPDYGSVLPRNKAAIPADALHVFAVLFRKIRWKKFGGCTPELDYAIGRAVRTLLFGRLTFDAYVTVACSMVGVFRGLQPGARIFNIQHGAMASFNTTYVSANGCATDFVRKNGIHVLFAGHGYRDLFLRTSDGYFKRNSSVIGSHPAPNVRHQAFNGNVLVTLPFAPDKDATYKDGYARMYGDLHRLLAENEAFFKQNGIAVHLRDHPRYDASEIDVRGLYAFPFVMKADAILSSCLEMCSLHVTYNSTACFEAAAVGVPTVFLGDDPGANRVFYGEYGYPLRRRQVIDEIKRYMDDASAYEDASQSVRQWYRRFYAPFCEDHFLKLME